MEILYTYGFNLLYDISSDRRLSSSSLLLNLTSRCCPGNSSTLALARVENKRPIQDQICMNTEFSYKTRRRLNNTISN